MDTSRLTHRVLLQSYRDTQELGGANTRNDWINSTPVWAHFESIKGLIRLDTMQISGAPTHKATIRYRPFVSTENWLLLGTRRFRIRGVTDIDERHKLLELLVEEDGYSDNTIRAGDSVE